MRAGAAAPTTGGLVESGPGVEEGRAPQPRAARERDPLRGHQDRLLIARPRPRPPRDRRHRHRRDGVPRLLHLLPRGRQARAARRLTALLAVRRRARAGRRRGPRGVGRADQDPRVHPREGDGGPADEVRPRARGGELPVDGRGPDPRQVRRRDRRRRPAHRGAARVRGRRAQLPRPHGVAGRRRDRERPALRGDPPAGAGPDDADRAEPGARGGHLREDLYDVVARGARELLRADACQIYRLDVEADELMLVGSDPAERRRAEHAARRHRPRARPDAPRQRLGRQRRRRRVARALWPDVDENALLVGAPRRPRRAARGDLLHRPRPPVHRRGRRAARRGRRTRPRSA